MAKKKRPPVRGKRRTREHIIADLSVHHVEGHVLRCGWTVQSIQPDYGLDLLLYTYNELGEAEISPIFMQVKASDEVKYVRGGAAIAVRVDRADIRPWRNQALPVILVMYDAQIDVAYWLYVQPYLRKRKRLESTGGGELVTLCIPTANVLNPTAVREFGRFRDRVEEQMKGIVHG